MHLRLGDAELAGELAAQSRERMGRVDDPMGLAVSLYFLGTAAATAGELPDARRLANEALQASERAGDVMIRGISSGLLGTIEWLLGDPPTAAAHLKEAVRIQAEIGHRWGLLTSLEGLAWVAGSSERPERAALLLGAGAALCQELGITLYPYGQAHHDACEKAVRTELGEARYRDCLERGYSLGADEVVAIALENEAAADRHAPQADDAHGADELSARELEVARLVAGGLSNRAIAADLFVSVATVKTHVSHILAKLGLESRVQVANWVAEHDSGPPAPGGP